MTYFKSYYWLIRLRYFAYTVSPSHWTYPSSGCYSLAVVAVHLLKLCCSQCCSPEYLQHAFFILIYAKCYMPYVIDSPRSIELENPGWRNSPDFAFARLSTGSFAPIVKWSTRPMVYSPCQLHYMHGNGPAILNIVVMWYSPAIRTKSGAYQ